MTVETGSEAEAPTEILAPAPRTAWATVPKVNLLPPEIFEVRRFRRVRQGLGVAILAVVAGAALATYWAQTEVDAARTDLDTAQSEVTTLQREQVKYAEAPRTIAQVEAAETARATAMTNDVLWHRFLSNVASVTPDGVDIQSMNVALAAATAAQPGQPAAAATAAPLTPVGIGSVTAEGEATSYGRVASWLDSVVRANGLDSSTLTTATLKDASGTAEDSPVTFGSGAIVTPKLLSHRYDRKAG